MELNKAVKFLTKQRDSISYRLECAQCVPFRSHYERMEEALTVVLRAVSTPPEADNAPLALEELRGMDGEPVWAQFGDGVECWAIAAIDGGYVILHNPDFDGEFCPDPDFYGMEYNDPVGHFGLHVLGWLAYRRPPEKG